MVKQSVELWRNLQDQRLEAITYKRKSAPTSELPISQFIYEYDIPKERIRKITRNSQQLGDGSFVYDFGYDEVRSAQVLDCISGTQHRQFF